MKPQPFPSLELKKKKSLLNPLEHAEEVSLHFSSWPPLAAKLTKDLRG